MVSIISGFKKIRNKYFFQLKKYVKQPVTKQKFYSDSIACNSNQKYTFIQKEIRNG